jgi:hypothetical protein
MSKALPAHLPDSLLVREINWLETSKVLIIKPSKGLSTPYSLGKLIDWKRGLLQECAMACCISLLVREINWLETNPFNDITNGFDVFWFLPTR